MITLLLQATNQSLALMQGEMVACFWFFSSMGRAFQVLGKSWWLPGMRWFYLSNPSIFYNELFIHECSRYRIGKLSTYVSMNGILGFRVILWSFFHFRFFQYHRSFLIHFVIFFHFTVIFLFTSSWFHFADFLYTLFLWLQSDLYFPRETLNPPEVSWLYTIILDLVPGIIPGTGNYNRRRDSSRW